MLPMLWQVMQLRLAELLLRLRLPVPQQADKLLRFSHLIPLPLRRLLPRRRLRLPYSPLAAASASRIG